VYANTLAVPNSTGEPCETGIHPKKAYIAGRKYTIDVELLRFGKDNRCSPDANLASSPEGW
jgi:hypothetical protein